MILSLGGQDQHGIYGWGGSVRGEKKSCRGETVSEQSATLPLKPIKPREAKRRKPETHPGPQSVDEAERDAAHTGCDLGWKRGRVGGKHKVFAILRHTNANAGSGARRPSTRGSVHALAHLEQLENGQRRA